MPKRSSSTSRWLAATAHPPKLRSSYLYACGSWSYRFVFNRLFLLVTETRKHVLAAGSFSSFPEHRTLSFTDGKVITRSQQRRDTQDSALNIVDEHVEN